MEEEHRNAEAPSLEHPAAGATNRAPSPPTRPDTRESRQEESRERSPRGEGRDSRSRRDDNNDDRDERRSRPRGRGRRRYAPSRKVCNFCVDGIDHIDYKQTDLLRRYLTDRGKIKARRKTGTCAKHQRRLAIAIKRARHVALLPFTGEQTR